MDFNMRWNFKSSQNNKATTDVVLILTPLIVGILVFSGLLSLLPQTDLLKSLSETTNTMALTLCTTLCNVLYQRNR
jgi:hypothetical protein